LGIQPCAAANAGEDVKKNTDGSVKATQQVRLRAGLVATPCLPEACADGMRALAMRACVRACVRCRRSSAAHLSRVNWRWVLGPARQATGVMRVKKGQKQGPPPNLVEVAFADEVPPEVRT
jgi:hypothetical protein